MRRIVAYVVASAFLVGCSSDEEPRSGSPEPSVTSDASGVVADAAPDGQTDRFLVDVETWSTGRDLGPSVVVVYEKEGLECSSGATPPDDSVEAGDAVDLVGIGGVSESDPPIIHPRRVLLDC